MQLTLDFYKRNYIEGLFLSSGIIRSADHTMELVIEVARKLREDHHFRGYIHLKTIPEASPALIETGGPLCRPHQHQHRAAQRAEHRAARAGEKPRPHPGRRWATSGRKIDERFAEKAKPGAPKPPPFATGQSTQMIVGADDSTDAVILRRADMLYTGYKLRRVYYSGFSPIPEPSSLLPIKPPPLVARAPALSGGLAAALLRLQGG